jgi:DNA-binding transcriptional MerR regulator
MAETIRAEMGIAELAERAGVTQRTIRYYVSEGLLPAPSGRGQRRAYNGEHLSRLARIHDLKAAYLPLHEIRRRLTSSAPDGHIGTEAKSAQAIQVPVTASGPADATVTRLPVRASPVATAAPPRISDAVSNRSPLGFGSQPEVGRIEIYEPVESVWRRHTLMPGVELHVQETDDPSLAEAIQRLIREAGPILDGNRTPGGPRP